MFPFSHEGTLAQATAKSSALLTAGSWTQAQTSQRDDCYQEASRLGDGPTKT